MASSATSIKATDAVIVSYARTPIGLFGGALASESAPSLGAVAIKSALSRAGLAGSDVNEAYMGNVLSANVGQAPARQAVLGAGLPTSVTCTTVNKVCASGTKAVMIAAASIQLGHSRVVLAGGMESMSSAPFYAPTQRWGGRYGHGQLLDAIQRDGLSDAYDGSLMGMCGEACAAEYGFSRAAQDAYAQRSYERARAAQANGAFATEIVGVDVKTRKGVVKVTADEEPMNLDLTKLSTLRPPFKKDGTVTAGNASKINDGAAALVLVSGEFAQQRGLKPLAVVRGYADAELAPIKFTDAPAYAIPLALQRAGLSLSQIDFFEINEAFAVVALCNARLLKLDEAKLNVDGGAVALGHPIGASGARIVASLTRILQQREGRFGVAAICNGGGGASAVVLERVRA